MNWFKLYKHPSWQILYKFNPAVAADYMDLLMMYWSMKGDVTYDQALIMYGEDAIKLMLKHHCIEKTKSTHPKIKIGYLDTQLKPLIKRSEKNLATDLQPNCNPTTPVNPENPEQNIEFKKIEKENKTKVKSMPKKEVLNSQSQAKKGEEQDEKSAHARPTKSPPKPSGLPPDEGAGLALADLYEFLSSQFKVTTHNKSRFSMSCSRCYQHYKDSAWHDTQGVKIRNWRGAAIQWMKIDGFSQKARPCPN